MKEAATGGSIKTSVLKNFAKFLGKHLCQSLFLIKLQASGFIEKRLWYMCFPVHFPKFFRTLFLQNTSELLHL